jgi:hypothetical protein
METGKRNKLDGFGSKGAVVWWYDAINPSGSCHFTGFNLQIESKSLIHTNPIYNLKSIPSKRPIRFYQITYMALSENSVPPNPLDHNHFPNINIAIQR